MLGGPSPVLCRNAYVSTQRTHQPNPQAAGHAPTHSAAKRSPPPPKTRTLQMQHARFVSKNSFRNVAQFIDLFRVQDEGTVFRRLPGAGVQQLPNDGLRKSWCARRVSASHWLGTPLQAVHTVAPQSTHPTTPPRTLEMQGSLGGFSNMGDSWFFVTLSGPILTRRLSFLNWSMDSWRTMPRSEPGRWERGCPVMRSLSLLRTAPRRTGTVTAHTASHMRRTPNPRSWLTLRLLGDHHGAVV